jgi:hypothetical protein
VTGQPKTGHVENSLEEVFDLFRILWKTGNLFTRAFFDKMTFDSQILYSKQYSKDLALPPTGTRAVAKVVCVEKAVQLQRRL